MLTDWEAQAVQYDLRRRDLASTVWNIPSLQQIIFDHRFDMKRCKDDTRLLTLDKSSSSLAIASLHRHIDSRDYQRIIRCSTSTVCLFCWFRCFDTG